MPAQTGKYFLPDEVFLCVAGSSMVFLDLRNDKYIGLRPDMTRPLMARISMYSDDCDVLALDAITKVTGERHETTEAAEECRRILADLLRSGLLTTDETRASNWRAVSVTIPSLDMSGYDFGSKPVMGLMHLVNFFCACLAAFLKVRFQTTARVVRSVRRRKNRCSSNYEAKKARDLVEIFKTLRPLFFTAKDHCLFDSLALIEFMARYEIYPTWVFGVQMGPFQAHCWVQDENFIYNEDMDKAHFFTPIMAV